MALGGVVAPGSLASVVLGGGGAGVVGGAGVGGGTGVCGGAGVAALGGSWWLERRGCDGAWAPGGLSAAVRGGAGV